MTKTRAVSIACLAVFCHAGIFAAFERLPAGARAHALCGASQISRRDPFCLESNPASIAAEGDTRIGISATPGLFGLAELQRTESALSFGCFGGSIGLLGRSFGFELYREITMVAGIAACVTPDISVGASLAWYSMRISGYGHASALGVNLGATIRLADQIQYGLSIRNVNRPQLGRSRELVPSEVLTCIEFRPLPSFLIAASLSKDPDTPLNGAFGVEWVVENHVVLRAGAQEELQQFGAGIGVMWGVVSIDYGLTIHPDLGLTHYFSVLLDIP